MKFYKDKYRIEDAIIPALLESIMLAHIKSKKEDAPAYDEPLRIVREALQNCFKGFDWKKTKKMHDRLNRVVNKILAYFVKQQFDSRKMFLATSCWAVFLIHGNYIDIDKESEMWQLLIDMAKVIEKGYDEIKDFDKIDRSAMRHVDRMHIVAQQEQYFEVIE